MSVSLKLNNMPNRDLLLQFANLKIKEKAIKAELDMVKDQALKEVELLVGDSDQPLALTELPGFSFSLASYKTWTYTHFVQDSEAALKERKSEEQKTGDATFTEEKQLRFNSPKQ